MSEQTGTTPGGRSPIAGRFPRWLIAALVLQTVLQVGVRAWLSPFQIELPKTWQGYLWRSPSGTLRVSDNPEPDEKPVGLAVVRYGVYPVLRPRSLTNWVRPAPLHRTYGSSTAVQIPPSGMLMWAPVQPYRPAIAAAIEPENPSLAAQVRRGDFYESRLYWRGVIFDLVLLMWLPLLAAAVVAWRRRTA